jgi:hypothetical protein
LQLGQTITMVFSLQGTGTLLANEGRSPAKVRLFVQRQGDTSTAEEPYKRWWSLAHVVLVSPGNFKLSAKIEPRAWSSVFGAVGSAAPTEFADCISNLAHWGFTFGGDFAGHGVYARGAGSASCSKNLEHQPPNSEQNGLAHHPRSTIINPGFAAISWGSCIGRYAAVRFRISIYCLDPARAAVTTSHVCS